jgi:hypothetical protein
MSALFLKKNFMTAEIFIDIMMPAYYILMHAHYSNHRR